MERLSWTVSRTRSASDRERVGEPAGRGDARLAGRGARVEELELAIGDRTGAILRTAPTRCPGRRAGRQASRPRGATALLLGQQPRHPGRLDAEQRDLLLAVASPRPGAAPFGFRTYLARVQATSACGSPRASEKWTARWAASSSVSWSGPCPFSSRTTTCAPARPRAWSQRSLPRATRSVSASFSGGAAPDQDRDAGERAEGPVRAARAPRAGGARPARGCGPAARCARLPLEPRQRLEGARRRPPRAAPGARRRARAPRPRAPPPARRSRRSAGSAGSSAPCSACGESAGSSATVTSRGPVLGPLGERHLALAAPQEAQVRLEEVRGPPVRLGCRHPRRLLGELLQRTPARARAPRAAARAAAGAPRRGAAPPRAPR